MWRVVIVLIAACTSSAMQAPSAGPCVDLEMAVTQTHGTCTVSLDGLVGECPWNEGAWCGLETNCPPVSEWAHTCRQSYNGIGSDCTYDAQFGCTVNGSDATFPMVQNLNGKDGLIINDDASRGGSATCHFEECL